jgi:hypothetical protein
MVAANFFGEQNRPEAKQKEERKGTASGVVI